MSAVSGRISSLAVTVVAVAATVVAPSGCSSGPGCTSTSVHVVSPRVTDLRAALDVNAAVTASGKPVAGVPVAVRGWGRPPGQTSEVGGELGTAVTGPDGIATVHVPATVPGGALSALNRLNGTDFVQVSVDVAAATVGGRAYCASKGDAPVVCGAASGECRVGLGFG